MSIPEAPLETETWHDDDHPVGETWDDDDHPVDKTEDDEPRLYISTTVGDGPFNTSTSASLTRTPTDDEVAGILIRVALGAAAMRGMDTWTALHKALTDYGRPQ